MDELIAPRLIILKRQKAKNPLIERAFLNRSLVMTYFHMANATLSSALFRFTTEFGMGSGGSRTLLSPSKLVTNRCCNQY